MKYSKELTQEIKRIFEHTGIKCPIYKFENLDRFDFNVISSQCYLSEEFMERFANKLNWEFISRWQRLSNGFIRKFKYELDWRQMVSTQALSEDLMEEHAQLIDWGNVARYQKLSEEFISKFKDRLFWGDVVNYQKLSEKFIEDNFKHIVRYGCSLVIFQELSEEFIEKHIEMIIAGSMSTHRNIAINILCHQKLSKKFREKLRKGILQGSSNKPILKNNWLYATVATKEKYIVEKTSYKIKEDEGGKYILAHKGIRSDNYSKYNFQYKYEIGQEYESNCDCYLEVDNSFGLSAWTLKDAKNYCNEKIILVKIYLKDIGAIVHDGGKIRCFKFKVMKELKPRKR